jgi:hypothetical protein
MRNWKQETRVKFYFKEMKIISLLFICCILYTCNLPNPGRRAYNFNPKIEVGQIWVKIDSLDPFSPIYYDTIKVLELKEDYAKVIRTGTYFKNCTTSMAISIVDWERRLVQEINK